MKIAIILLLALVPLYAHAEQKNETTTSVVVTTQTHKTPQWGEFRNTLLSSILPGALVGSLSGWGCYKLEEHVLNNNGNINVSRLLTWIGFSLARSTVVSTVSKTMSDHDIRHSPALMQSTAWIVDWLTYLYKIR